MISVLELRGKQPVQPGAETKGKVAGSMPGLLGTRFAFRMCVDVWKKSLHCRFTECQSPYVNVFRLCQVDNWTYAQKEGNVETSVVHEHPIWSSLPPG